MVFALLCVGELFPVFYGVCSAVCVGELFPVFYAVCSAVCR